MPDLTERLNAGEILGAAGVIITLLYLSIQIRTNAQATHVENADRVLGRVNASNLIPDGAILLGITARVSTTFGTANSMTGLTIGISGGDTDIWGTLSALTAGSFSNPTTAGWTTVFERHIAATDVTMTAVGGTGFEDGVGVLEIVVHYIELTAPTS